MKRSRLSWVCAAISVLAAGCANETPTEIQTVVVEKTIVVCDATTCSATCCGDVCRDVTSNNNHCGACNHACGDKEICREGVCVFSPIAACEAGEQFCDDKCVSVLNDRNNCGECGKVCLEDQKCHHRECVKDCGDATYCAGECVDLLNDRNNCGTCDNVCAGNEVCSNGKCSTSCAFDNEKICSMMCLDIMGSKDHCGDCTTVCIDGTSCIKGSCTCDERDKTLCSGECVDLNTSNENCGRCGKTCPTDQMCVWGKCVKDCDTLVCDHICLDGDTDPAHCGTCDNACEDGQTCINGECTTKCALSNEGVCGHECIDIKSDINNCGGCGIECPDNTTCRNGSCSEFCDGDSEIVCGHECVDYLSNPEHCGDCSITCENNEFCRDEECLDTCDDENETVCNHVCTDLKKDDKNCGECGLECTGVDICRDGICGCPDSDPYCHLVCDEGLKGCDGECVFLQNNVKNCGKCGNDCGEGNLCVDGQCVNCAGKNLCEDGICYDFETDSKNCGGCGIVCTNHIACSNGLCNACEPDYVDCNGDISDGCESTIADCECQDGETKSCYYGPAGTEGIGACHAGTTTCSNHKWGACEGMVIPTVNYKCLKSISDKTKNDLNCDGIVDGTEDYDGDGFSICGGDCCDIGGQNAGCPATIKNPGVINPAMYEVPANGFDDNCNNRVDEAPNTCTASMPGSDLTVAANRNATGKQMARAMDICDDAATANYGLVSATVQTMSTISDYLGGADITVKSCFGTSKSESKGGLSKAINIFTKLTNRKSATYNINPQYGSTFAAISTGNFSTGYLSASDAFMRYIKTSGCGLVTSDSSDSNPDLLKETVPQSYLIAQENGALKTFLGCPSAQQIHDGVNLSLKLKAPRNATGFQFDFRFYSHEYPNYICSKYNDFFIALLDSKAPGIPKDGNIVFDKHGNTVSVNNAFFTSCTPISCSKECSVIYNGGCVNGKCTSEYGACPAGSNDLAAFSSSDDTLGGATAWLTTKAPVIGGETFNLNFYIWDTGDNNLDSAAIIDNFRWITNGDTVEVGTDFKDVRN